MIFDSRSTIFIDENEMCAYIQLDVGTCYACYYVSSPGRRPPSQFRYSKYSIGNERNLKCQLPSLVPGLYSNTSHPSWLLIESKTKNEDKKKLFLLRRERQKKVEAASC